MSVSVGPKITTSDLLVNLDAANIKSYPYHPGPADHGISEWYCFVTGNVTFAAMENVTIYEVTDLGVTSVKVSPSAVPQKGTFAITAGYQYYADGPMFLVAEDNHHYIAPMTMSGTQFGHYTTTRDVADQWDYYIYAPYSNATVNFHIGTANGINDPATATISVSKGAQSVYSILEANQEKFVYISSDEPVIITVVNVGAGPWDKTILSPARPILYNRPLGYYGRMIGGASPSVGGTNSTAVYSANGTDNVFSYTVADGDGGDSAQGLGPDFLCDRYIFGNVLSDYALVAPYESTIVDVSYWSGTAWVLLERHTLTGGTATSPQYQFRDGTTGVGVDGTIISGLAANFASGANLWKWESNNPFYLCINDSTNDELSMLGWTSSRSVRTVNNADLNWKNLVNYSTLSDIRNGVDYSSSNGGIMAFDGADDYALVSDSGYPASWSDPFSMECWMYVPTGAAWSNSAISPIIIRGAYSGSHGIGRSTTNNIVQTYIRGDSGAVAAYATIARDAWHHGVGTCNGSTTSIFVNGALIQTSVSIVQTGIPEQDSWRIGQAYAFGGTNGIAYQGSLANVKIYSKALTASEVAQNFEAHRGRFGI